MEPDSHPKKIRWVLSDTRVSKRWQNFIKGWTVPLIQKLCRLIKIKLAKEGFFS